MFHNIKRFLKIVFGGIPSRTICKPYEFKATPYKAINKITQVKLNA